MNDIVRKVFLSILKQLDSNFIFNNDHRNGFKAALGKAKIADFRFHDLRHAFASYLVMACVPLNTIRESSWAFDPQQGVAIFSSKKFHGAVAKW